MKVSVCIPTYNRSDLLLRALRSAICQDFQDMEIIISDNHSEEIHWRKIQELQSLDQRIIVNRNEKNLGWTGNINQCLTISRGEYVIFLCDDDEFIQGIISELSHFLDQNPSVGIVHSNGYRCYPNGDMIPFNSQKEEIIKSGVPALTKILLENTVFFSSALVRKECFLKNGVFTDTCSADWEMWARISRYYDLGHVNKNLVKFYIHSLSVNARAGKYEKDWKFLGETILSYFPAEIRKNYQSRLNSEIGNGLFSLGVQALKEGRYKTGWEFIQKARNYKRLGSWIFKAFETTVFLLPRRIKWIKNSKMAYETYI